MQESIKKINEVIGSNYKYKRALFAISSLGLGHATRTLPIIKFYLKKDFDINIISYGNTLDFLKQELKGFQKIEFIEFQDYPALERGIGIKFYYYLIIDLFNTQKIIKKENKFINNLGNNFDFIFSDGRYGIYKKGIKSFLLSHQISFIMPKGLKIFQKFSDYFNYKFFKKFDGIFIPDFKYENKSLAGKLSHNKILKKINHKYIGTLTSYYGLDIKNLDIDYYFIISGYLNEHKNDFVNKLIKQVKKIEGKKVFILGDTSKYFEKTIEKYNIEIYSSVSNDKRLDFFSRAKVVVSRAGYTTIMDLIANKKSGILFPTPNQTEQEYLADYLGKKGFFVNGGEKQNFNLIDLIKKI